MGEVLHLPELAETEALEIDDHKTSIDRFTSLPCGSGEDFSGERLGVDDDALPMSFRRDVFVEFGHVYPAKEMDVERSPFLSECFRMTCYNS